MWQSEWAGRDKMLYSWVTQDTVLRDLGHLLQRVALLPDLSSHLSQGLFSNSQHITATNHQSHTPPCVCLDLAKLSCPCSSLQCWHCLGLFILLLQVPPKAFHCLCPQNLRDEDVSYIWYQYDDKKHEYYINVSVILILYTILLKNASAQSDAELKGWAHLLRDNLHSMNRTYIYIYSI